MTCLIALMISFATLAGCSKPAGQQEALDSADQTTSEEEKPGQANFYYVESGNKPLAQVEDAIRDSKLEDGTAEYYYNFVDLNGDRNHEVFIYLRNSVETAGKLLIMSSDFKTSLGIIETKMPIIVLNRDGLEENWADLAVYQGNGQYLRYLFVDNVYQLSENSKENVIEFSKINGVGYLSDVNDKNGFKIQ